MKLRGYFRWYPMPALLSFRKAGLVNRLWLSGIVHDLELRLHTHNLAAGRNGAVPAGAVWLRLAQA